MTCERDTVGRVTCDRETVGRVIYALKLNTGDKDTVQWEE